MCRPPLPNKNASHTLTFIPMFIFLSYAHNTHTSSHVHHAFPHIPHPLIFLKKNNTTTRKHTSTSPALIPHYLSLQYPSYSKQYAHPHPVLTTHHFMPPTLPLLTPYTFLKLMKKRCNACQNSSPILSSPPPNLLL